MAIDVRIVGLKALRDRIKRLADPGPITRRLHNRLIVAWRDSADAFIRAAITEVLVDTGESAATFFPLSRAIKRIGAEATIRAHITALGGGRVAKGRSDFPSGKWNPSGKRSVGEGTKRGKKAFRFTVGTPKVPVFTFSFQTVVFQFAFHELEQQALQEGIIAFEEATRKRFVEEAEFVIQNFLSGKRFSAGRIVL